MSDRSPYDKPRPVLFGVVWSPLLTVAVAAVFGVGCWALLGWAGVTLMDALRG